MYVLYIVVCPFALFSFGHCVVCSSSIYRFWLPLWYLRSLLSTVVLTVKASASSEACIVEHPSSAKLLLRMLMLITFCLYFESARNSSFLDLKSVYSVNSTLDPTVVPVRLRCVISLVDYLLWCVVKSLFLCVSIFCSCAIFHIFYSCIYRWFAFSSIFPLHNCIQVCPSLKSILNLLYAMLS